MKNDELGGYSTEPSKEVNLDNVDVFEAIKDLRTEIVTEERRVLDSAKLLNYIINTLDEIIYVTDEKLYLTHANQACLKFVGAKTLEEVTNRPCFDVFACHSTNYHGTGSCCVADIHKPDNATLSTKHQYFCTTYNKWFESQVYFVNSNINSYIHIIRDITKEKVVVEKLNDCKQENQENTETSRA